MRVRSILRIFGPYIAQARAHGPTGCHVISDHRFPIRGLGLSQFWPSRDQALNGEVLSCTVHFRPFPFTSALPHFITSFEFKVLFAIHFRYSDNPEITSSFAYVPEPFSIHMFTIYCNFYIPDHSRLLMPFRSISRFHIRSRPLIHNCSAPISI